MQQINLSEASKHLSELIEAAIKGEEIIITKGEQPIAKIVPFKRGCHAGSAKGLVTMSEDFDEPLEDFKVWRSGNRHHHASCFNAHKGALHWLNFPQNLKSKI